MPSQNSEKELIILLSILKLVKHCSTLLHTMGNFAEMLIGEMTADAMTLNLDDLDEDHVLFSANNSLSVNVSKTSF
jgi:hypothetical protein